MKTHLVLTTINNPVLLEDYARHAASSKGDVAFTVAGDRKTPVAARDLCARLEKEYKFPVTYMGEAEQNTFLEKWPAFANYLPWNCVQRRNVGMMYAYAAGADVIVTIDDDNFIATEDYFGGHAVVGRDTALPTVSDPSGWFNICQFLKDEHDRFFYPRGFPSEHRKSQEKNIKMTEEKGRVVVNGGLWLGDPDVDAVTRLANPINAVSYTRQDNFTLGQKTWCPFNSQNTAIHRDCIPAYFLSPSVGRYDDIWASFVILRLADHLDDRVAFGNPLVRQDRNAHDIWRDLDLERLGMQLTDQFCTWLRTIPLTAQTYHQSCLQLMKGLKAEMEKNKTTLKDNQYQFIDSFIDGYMQWLNLDLWSGE